MAKRYTQDDLPIIPKRDCIVCGRAARGSAHKLVSNGWLMTTKGIVCPACPDDDEDGGHTVDSPKA